MPPGGIPSAGYKFNSFQEIRSHSSILFNERLAILFYMLDMRGIDMNTYYRVEDMMQVRGYLKQIYKNIRTLLRNNPVCRATLNLDTKDQGIYVTDVAISIIDKMIEYCDVNGYSTKKLYIIIEELNKFEMLIKDVLQYYQYFVRGDFRQKPDIEIATERYKEIADKTTVDELRAIVGKNHQIDFEGLGSNRVDLKKEIAFDPLVDGEDGEVEEQEETGDQQEEQADEE